jgi:protein O-GlcNAc transferase
MEMATAADILNQAVRLHQGGNLAQAEALYRQILQADPRNAPALHLLGSLAHQTGHHDAAVALIGQAIAINPLASIFHFNLGLVHKKRGQWAEATACFQKSLRINPAHAETSIYLGQVLIEQGIFVEAIACYREALRLNPSHVDLHVNMGNAFFDKGQLDEAEACFRQALQIDPYHAGACINLGNTLRDQGRFDEALACYLEAQKLEPAKPHAYSNRLFTLIYHPGWDARAIFEEQRRWEQEQAHSLTPSGVGYANERVPERRLRIGYVSPNFREQAETFFTIPLFAAHDHQAFEIYFYADVARADQLTARIRSHADQWRNIVGVSDHDLAQFVRQDQIDILVDLTMHMASNRVLTFARKPAPVQVCWLAYQGTTGLATMDYRLTDALVDPPGLFDSFYSEKSIRLPDAFGCYDPLSDGPTVRQLPALQNGYITFGSLHNFCKLHDDVLRLWAKVVRAVEQARLLMLAPDGSRRRRILEIFQQEGVAAERLDFRAKRPRAPYLELYHEFDIGLDSYPYNGQTTTLDSLWMGVPVLTLVGRTAVGRAGLSLLQNVGLPDWITVTPEQFVLRAVQLSRDLESLGRLRASLRARLQQSPLMDGRRFARNVEAAYRAMWRRWCAV